MHARNLFSIGATCTFALTLLSGPVAASIADKEPDGNYIFIDGYKYRKTIDEHPACKGSVDLVLVLKWPSGMDKHKWYKKIVDYLPNFISKLDINEDRFRVGLIMSNNYNRDFTIDLNTEDSYNKDKLLEQVTKEVDLNNFLFGVKLETMLENAYLMLKNSKRLNATKMLFLLTDGAHVNKEKVEVVFDKIRAHKIQLYVQGLGPTSQLWVKPHMGCIVSNEYPCPNFILTTLDEDLDANLGFNRMCIGVPQNAVCKITYGNFNSCELPCNPYSVKSAFAVSYKTIRGPTFGYIGIKQGVDCKTQAYHKDLIFERCGPKDCMTEEEYANHLEKMKNKKTTPHGLKQIKGNDVAENVQEDAKEDAKEVARTEEAVEEKNDQQKPQDEPVTDEAQMQAELEKVENNLSDQVVEAKENAVETAQENEGGNEEAEAEAKDVQEGGDAHVETEGANEHEQAEELGGQDELHGETEEGQAENEHEEAEEYVDEHGVEHGVGHEHEHEHEDEREHEEYGTDHLNDNDEGYETEHGYQGEEDEEGHVDVPIPHENQTTTVEAPINEVGHEEHVVAEPAKPVNRTKRFWDAAKRIKNFMGGVSGFKYKPQIRRKDEPQNATLGTNGVNWTNMNLQHDNHRENHHENNHENNHEKHINHENIANVVNDNKMNNANGGNAGHELPDEDDSLHLGFMSANNQNVKIAGGVVGSVVLLGLAGLAFSKRRKQSVGYGYTGIVYDNDDDDIKYDESPEEFTITGIDNALWGEK